MSHDPAVCTRCGTPVPVGAPFGCCPGCLVDSALADHPAASDDGPDPTAPGEFIGSYRLLGKLGEGGFGEVYEAEQEKPVRRRVALKLLKRGMDTRQVVARFEAERQALALMDHPHVATVYDAGESDDGRPFFVMELVEGQPLTDYCRDHRHSLRQRLDLFIAVCEGVQHAHAKGLIHRDLKPSNVLVTERDGQPVPKVIDFGIAKATDQLLTAKTIYTELGRFLGTPVYMSPEQAGGDGANHDIRSDVYSLGAMLYEVLTGCTPFDGDRLRRVGYTEMERVLKEEDPPKPSARVRETESESPSPPLDARRLRGDLDWIVMRALEKDPERRYPTVAAFAKDLSRHLENIPVEAGPPTSFYLIRKFARRNKVALATGAAVLLALVAGTIVSTWQAVRATRAEEEAKIQAGRAREAEQLAHEEAKVGDTFASFLADDLMAAAFSEGLPTLDKLVGVMQDGARRLDALDDQPLVQAGGFLMLGRLYDWWLVHDRAEEFARRSWTIYARELGRSHEKTLQAALVRLRTTLKLERFADAEEILAAILPAARDRYPVGHPMVIELLGIQVTLLAKSGRVQDTLPLLGELIAADPADQAQWIRLAKTHYALSEAALVDGRDREAVEEMLCATSLIFLYNSTDGYWQERGTGASALRSKLIQAGLIPSEWLDSTVMIKAQEADTILAMLALPTPAAELVRAKLLEKQGDLEAAVALVRSVTGATPQSHVIRNGYGLLLERAGWEEKAVVELRRAMLDAARDNDVARVRWYSANWNRLRSKLGLPLATGSLPRSQQLVDPGTGHHYVRLEVPLPWHDAREACRELGGHLAIITTREEDALVSDRFAKSHLCWLGAYNHETTGEWRWVDGTPMDFSNWGAGQPNGTDGDGYFLAVGNVPKFSILGASFSWTLSGWNDHTGPGTLTNRFDGNPMGLVVATFPICEWESEEAWRTGTAGE